MAQRTRHPIGPAPTAPVRESTLQLVMRGWAVFIFTSALCMGGWTNLLGPVGVAILLGVTMAITIAAWTLIPALAVRSARAAWRRLPWSLLAYLILGGCSILWSAWPQTSLVTWSVAVVTTLQAIFFATTLTWREFVRVMVSALRWVLGLTVVFELFAAVIVRGPIVAPAFAQQGKTDPRLFWSAGNLFDLHSRVNGLPGNANLIGIAALLAIAVFTIAMASRISSVPWSVTWLVVATLLLWRSGSATSLLALFAVTIVTATALIMRSAVGSRRTLLYGIFAAIGIATAIVLYVNWDETMHLLGRNSDLTDRADIWHMIGLRAQRRPWFGSGFATPWLPWDPAFSHWILQRGLPVFTAHDMWVDAFLQLGTIGVILLGIAMLALLWRAWFFAVDRPRWDLDAHRPYTAVSLLPLLIVTILLVQGITESRPLMEWGWLMIVLLSFKMKASPIVGFGAGEQRLALERGELPARRR